MKCDRCKKPMTIFRVSWFNTQEICEACQKREAAHPDFEKAKEAERQACLQGNYNFKGIGLPKELERRHNV